MKQKIEADYKQVKLHSTQIVESEPDRIKNDPDLQHLVQGLAFKHIKLKSR